MRRQHGLKGNGCTDCLIHCCCEPCALCQEYRELQNRGFDMIIGISSHLYFSHFTCFYLGSVLWLLQYFSELLHLPIELHRKGSNENSKRKFNFCLTCFGLNLVWLGWHGNVEQRSRGVAMTAVTAPSVEQGMNR